MIYIETDRLILRSWTSGDLHTFVSMNQDKQVMRYFPALLTEEETLLFYRKIVAEFDTKGYGLYAVELKSTGEFIGYVGLNEVGFHSHFTPGVEIGWRLAAEHHNKGYATEAAKGVLSLAKNIGIGCLYSFTALPNKPSERVMQKIGMIKVGDFSHPSLDASSPLCVHVLYKINL